MQVISYNHDDPNGPIADAMSDCGRYRYTPIGNDRVRIDGKDAYRKQYQTGPMVADDDWAAVCALMTEVDAHNRAVLDRWAREAEDRRSAREEAFERSLEGARGHAYDPRTW